MKRRISYIFIVLLSVITTVSAHDFSATINGQRIYFNITDTLQNTAEITFKGSISEHAIPEIKGKINIPATVRHLNKVYTVNAIGAKAFSGASELTSVTLPSSIKQIGDFAFERCGNLHSVTFPSSEPKLGEGTFFQCTCLRDVSLGTDWKQIDFRMFRWSDSLHTVTIPSRITRIRGLKSLRRLTTINVDANNTAYTAIDGLLYDKSVRRLLCVPRAYNDTIKVREGVSEVLWGALIDCPLIKDLELPATVTIFSFRELSRMKGLRSITVNGERLLSTASFAGHDTTMFMVANPDVELNVPKKMVKAYKKALALPEGNYTEIAANMPQGTNEVVAKSPYFVRREQMINPKKIKSITLKK